jgi:Protein of unknown function (DUF2846)
MDQKVSLRAILVVLVLGLTGCGAHGTKFRALDDVPSGKAIIYFYRPWHFRAGGADFTVFDGETPLVTMVNGGYFTYVATPGEHVVAARSESRIEKTIDIRPGQTYYVRVTPGSGGVILSRASVELVDATIGANEIKDLSLLPALFALVLVACDQAPPHSNFGDSVADEHLISRQSWFETAMPAKSSPRISPVTNQSCLWCRIGTSTRANPPEQR